MNAIVSDAAVGATNRVGKWLRERRRATLLLIALASVAIRAVYFLQLAAGPCIWEHRWREWDMEFFDRWARQITAGDWLGRVPLHPYHRWHAETAAAYFEYNLQDPLSGEFLDARSQEERDAAGRELWNRWYGGTRFHQEPLYAYLLALTYAALGADVRWVFAWQMALGVASNLLVYLLARRTMGDLVAVLAAALAVCCAPVLYYELILHRTATIVFATLAIAWTASIALDRGSRRWWLLAGAASGLGLLLQSLLAIMAAGVVGLLILEARGDRAALVRNAASAALGAAIVLAPLVARNLAVGTPPFGLSSVGAVTFISSNAADVRPDAGFFLSAHTAEVMGRSQGRFLPAMIGTLETHTGSASIARLLAGKLAALWHWYEIPNNTNFYFFRLHASVLRFLPVTFTLMGALGFLGLLLALPAIRRHAIIYLLVVSSATPLLLFYVLSRFRAPLLLALAPFAAFAVVKTADWFLSGQRLRAALATAGGLALLISVSRPLSPDRPLIRIQDHLVTYEIYYRPLATEAERAGDWRRSAAVLAEFLKLEPEEVRRGEAQNTPRSSSVRSFAGQYGRIHQRYAEALAKSGLE